MTQETLAALCSLYSLGVPSAPPQRVPGGLVHRLYRVRTTRGQFAVKLLSADALAAPDARARFRQGERIAAAVAAAGLPAVAALEAQGDVLHEVGAATVLVYPWRDGRTLPSSPAGPDYAGKIGSVLGRIHRLPLSLLVPTLPPAVPVFTEGEWSALADRAEHSGVGGGSLLASALPDLVRWGEIYRRGQQALTGRWTPGHGDLHPLNVLWTDEDTFWILDWELAGACPPPREAVVCALEWSGFVEGDPDLPTFRAFLKAYRGTSPLSTEEALHGLDACFGNWLGWLRFCAQRVLESVTADPEERAEDARQVVGTLATVRRVERLLPTLRRACHE